MGSLKKSYSFAWVIWNVHRWRHILSSGHEATEWWIISAFAFVLMGSSVLAFVLMGLRLW